MIYPKIINNFSYILSKKTSNGIKLFIFILTISIIILFIILNNFEYYKSKKYFGYVIKENVFYTLIYADEHDVNDIVRANNCNNKDFKVVNIKNNYLIDNKKYSLIKLDYDLDEEDKIENNIIELVFKLEKTTFLKELRKEIKTWIN